MNRDYMKVAGEDPLHTGGSKSLGAGLRHHIVGRADLLVQLVGTAGQQVVLGQETYVGIQLGDVGGSLRTPLDDIGAEEPQFTCRAGRFLARMGLLLLPS